MRNFPQTKQKKVIKYFTRKKNFIPTITLIEECVPGSHSTPGVPEESVAGGHNTCTTLRRDRHIIGFLRH